MKRREFLGKTGCGVASIAAATSGLALGKGQEQPRRRYKIEVEIYENKKNRTCHKVGEKFKYPEDIGKICPWFLSSMHDPIILLQRGVTLPWKYEGTPYEKVIDPDGITTEYIRCPDPTANLVAKIIRTKVS
jgi:uncharacterized repeat protein (TIGR04076 family)